MHLPESNGLPVNLLAACFNNTSATYKYYWLLSILQEVENGNLKVSKWNLFARMISNAWFTVNYFHVSFGKQDLIQDAVRVVNGIEKISIDEKREIVFQKLLITTKSETKKQLWHFNKNVPHWFLSPWFPKKDRTEIYSASKSFSEKCLYALHEHEIEINPEWKSYLISNARVLKDFCYWNLALFLQAKNPNVPDIPNKLIKPAVRNSLTQQRTQFWDLVLKELGSVKCIYTGEKLVVGKYAVEHFIPYSFVSHDLIWNLIPADKSFNSSKSDKLPPLEKYFNSFFALQKTAIEIVSTKSPKSKLLEDYLTIFPDLQKSFSKDKFRETIQPLITIASNNGFEFMK
jgi:5-methylcytosine-specific restriction endonuclease McrA